MDKESREVIGFGVSFTLAIGVAIIIISILASIGYWVIYPQILEWKYEANRNSQEYITTTQRVLQEKLTTYLNLETEVAELSRGSDNNNIIAGMRAQQKAILNEMRSLVETIDPQQIPPNVAKFLAEHPSNFE
jgi:hypothetical protein